MLNKDSLCPRTTPIFQMVVLSYVNKLNPTFKELQLWICIYILLNTTRPWSDDELDLKVVMTSILLKELDGCSIKVSNITLLCHPSPKRGIKQLLQRNRTPASLENKHEWRVSSPTAPVIFEWLDSTETSWTRHPKNSFGYIRSNESSEL